MYVYVWSCMIICDHVSSYISTYDHAWLSVIRPYRIWFCITIYYLVWSSSRSLMPMYDRGWSYAIVHHPLWPHIVMYDHRWSYMIMHDLTWSCVIMNSRLLSWLITYAHVLAQCGFASRTTVGVMIMKMVMITMTTTNDVRFPNFQFLCLSLCTTM